MANGKRNIGAYIFAMFALLLTLAFGNATIDSFNAEGFSLRSIVYLFSRKRSPYFEITIASGSKAFCEGLVNTIKENTGIPANIRKISENLYVIQYSCSRGEKLANFIYSEANLFLERKYLPYKNNILEV